MLALAWRQTCRRNFSTTVPVLSGHNKWSKIKQKKGAMDAQKSVVYGRAARDIMVAVRTGGSADPAQNIALANALKKARSDGVPKTNVDTALAKARGDSDKGTQLMTYEAMAHGCVGIIIECLTDNGNRTIHKVREILGDHNARLAAAGFLFERKGCVRVVVDKTEDFERRLETVIETALAAEAEDFEEQNVTEDAVEVEVCSLSPPSLSDDHLSLSLFLVQFTCAPQSLAKLTAAVTAPGLVRELLNSELIYAPGMPGEADEEMENAVGELVQKLEDHEDTLRVWTTLDS
ncbi:YebC-like protein [Amylostereum chailletii]|nr:YebC-like protein [Amylostereum chailletii]